MVRHDEMRPLADHQTLGDIQAILLQTVYLVQKHVRVYNHAVANYIHGLRPENSTRNEMDTEFSIVVHYGVACVVSSRKTCHNIGVAGKDIDYLALSFVAPLRSKNSVGRHSVSSFMMGIRPQINPRKYIR